ncbi:aspartyl aminopeptidase [Nannizzia gypsea CBS 118893]|uniref:aspartyl aminopeptidase n=1 Tax=Arthroderma gypseum (strain ATCC MYA-4604 / CBS 118893) TaxID=535722 RepID=E4V0R4_ARTGP|nr:aspartyl aminopeptidase [Nannizzia gypsea CBS 118893]EFR03629.1 aspartyl aminopeptidase [Nannizzia gypsea CBS 118893]
MITADEKARAQDFLSFVNASPTPFHAVASATKRFTDAGFKEIKEKDCWSEVCKPGGKYYVTRNGSTIIAFAVGNKWKPGNSIAMIGAHTDSPCLRIKPVSKRTNEGFIQIAVEPYGGGIWHTWFDRDLGIAGRVMVRQQDGTIASKLVHVDKPILRIPTLAIHLDRTETFAFNKETQLVPICGMVAAELSKTAEGAKSEEADGAVSPFKKITERHHPCLIELLASELSAKPEDIIDFEMLLYDTHKSCLGGMMDQFIFSPRLDNLNSSFCATVALVESLAKPSALENESAIRLVALFDHEEIGSRTAQGADSNILPGIIHRLSMLRVSGTKSDEDLSTAYEQSLSTSFLVSADMAHAVNPNYAYKYESEHKPEINRGPVIKVNANARYATNSPGIVLMHEIARAAEAKSDISSDSIVPMQLLVVRNDSSCGSTIGPMLSAALGSRTLDLGSPQLSMHSIRETGGTKDVALATRLFTSFFENYTTLAPKILVD